MDSGNILKFSNLFHLNCGGSVELIDKLNYHLTGIIILFIISLISARQYIGKPIQCWIPQEFTLAWEDYLEHMCWVQNTYFLLPSQSIPVSDLETLDQKHITYYQWVTIFLGLQAVLSYLPNLFWQIGAHRFPLLLRSAREATLPDKNLRKKIVSILTASVEEQTEFSTRFKTTNSILYKFMCKIAPNSRNTTVFIMSRILSIGNSVGQIYLMQTYLGYKHPFFGIHILHSITSGEDWKQSGYFPRVTYCRVLIRRWGVKDASYTVQCVLSLNYFLEKVYVFLWFWFCSLACLTFCNTLIWIMNLYLPFRRFQFITQYLRALKQVSSNDERDCDRFVKYVLGLDGILLLRAVSGTVSDLIALDVSSKLWIKYKRSRFTSKEENLTRLLEGLHKSTEVAVV